jgi:hypothetical protein
MQAMFKSELAKLAGVSSRTFRRYLATRRAILTAMGVSPFARKLPPHVVHYISEDYCIDIPNAAADNKLKVHPQGESFVDFTKTLTKKVFLRSQLSPCQRLARVWEWFEAFLRTRKGGWL